MSPERLAWIVEQLPLGHALSVRDRHGNWPKKDSPTYPPLPTAATIVTAELQAHWHNDTTAGMYLSVTDSDGNTWDSEIDQEIDLEELP